MFPTSPGPFPNYYDGELRASCGVLTQSNRSVKHEAKQKNSSARKAGSVYANLFMDSASVGATLQVVWSEKGYKLWILPPPDSDWFTCFMTCF